MLEFHKLASKGLELILLIKCQFVFFIINIRMYNYGINDVSKHVNIASKRVNIARINVASRQYRIVQTSNQSARGSHHVIICMFFIAKIALNSSAKQP